MAELSTVAASAAGVSQTTRAMSQEVRDTYRAWSETAPPFSSKEAEGQAALDAACAEAAMNNWDGYGAVPVTYGVKIRAQQFLDSLPSVVPLPIIAADPDGEIGFEWYLGPRQVFSVSVGERYGIAYAGVFGANVVHGTEYFMDEFPSEIMNHLRRLYGDNALAR